MLIAIYVEVDRTDPDTAPYLDLDHEMGVTADVYEWLTSGDDLGAPLARIGEVTDVKLITP